VTLPAEPTAADTFAFDGAVTGFGPEDPSTFAAAPMPMAFGFGDGGEAETSFIAPDAQPLSSPPPMHAFGDSAPDAAPLDFGAGVELGAFMPMDVPVDQGAAGDAANSGEGESSGTLMFNSDLNDLLAGLGAFQPSGFSNDDAQ